MKIVCRARKSKSCYHGRECLPLYGEDTMAGDGTYDGESVICDACYIAGGQPAVSWPTTRQEMLDYVDQEMGL